MEKFKDSFSFFLFKRTNTQDVYLNTEYSKSNTLKEMQINFKLEVNNEKKKTTKTYFLLPIFCFI